MILDTFRECQPVKLLKRLVGRVMKSAFKIIRAALFWSLTSLIVLAFVVLPQTTQP